MSRAFFNGKAATWDQTVAEKDETKLREMAGWLSIRPGSTVLDVGTGTGVFLPYLAAVVGGDGRIVAVDVAERMLRLAVAKSLAGNLRYVQAGASRLPLPDTYFDAVVCYSSFPHLTPLEETLRELNRVLVRGGRLLVCHTSSREKINGIHRSMAPVSDHLIPDESQMESLLEGAGFGEVVVEDRPDSYLASAMKST